MKHLFLIPLFLFCLNGAAYADNAGTLLPADTLKSRYVPDYEEDWSLYGDFSAIYQGYPSYHASYSGAQSLPSHKLGNNLEVAEFSLGRKLWQGAAFYIDPQFYRGFGLNGTTGLAGFPDGLANKGGTQYVYPELARAYIQQVIGFGGATETLTRGPNQVQETVDISRITITAGKFAYTDQFDDNVYSHDPETQFMNWSFMDSLAWDWAQDANGYAWGSVIDLNQKDWALRYGAMVPVNEINGNRFALRGANELDNTLELEERYNVLNYPGKTRILLFYNREIAGNFAEALSMRGDINSAIVDTREYGRVEYGAALNIEQQLNKDLGAFARISWNNGDTENFGFTQANESVAFGLSLQGKQWNRDDDVLGAAVAVNGISNEQKTALQAGYTSGLIIGDGNLSYGGESIVETFYNYTLNEYAFIGPDYQFILDPAYNTSRGPVNVFAMRLNAKF